jgi:hypothetical protein
MDKSQLKALESSVQILSVIDKGALFGGDIWQASKIEKQGRHLSKIIEITRELNSERFILKISGSVEIDSKLPFFIRLNYRNLIFRLFPGQYEVLGDKIFCFSPREGMALEERKGGDRYVLPHKEDISLSLKRLKRSLKDLPHELEVRIIDVSERGFGILISGQNKDYLKKNDHFWISSIDHTPLHDPLFGTVCYVVSKGVRSQRCDVRLGVALSRSLAPEMMAYLIRRSCLVLNS